MAASRPATRSGVIRLRLSGVAFLLVIAGLVGLTVALYRQEFTPTVNVTLKVDRAGNQLSAPADVKLRGLLVGQARSIRSYGQGALLELALDPATVDLIPRNIQAQLLPKTLFGEKYVALVLPPDPSSRHLVAGDVIGQDHSSTARETATLVDDLMPVLQTLKPVQLSLTLNAVAGALRGRGAALGANLALVDGYLQQLNPALPTIRRDVVGLADLADTVEAARPDLVSVLDNLSFTSRSLVDRRTQLDAFLTGTLGASDKLAALLQDDGPRLVTLAAASLPPLQVYDRYAPEFSCLLQGLAQWNSRVQTSFGGAVPGLHITLSTVKDQGAFVPGQQPAFLDDRGARCYGLPAPATPLPAASFKDGYTNARAAPMSGPAAAALASDPALALSGADGQRRLLNTAVAPVLGLAPADVPDLVSLLFGPLARGTVVGLA